MRYLFSSAISFFLALFLMLPVSSVTAAGFALKFDGIDDYVDVGSDSSLNLGSFFEISLRVKTSDASSGPIFIGRIDAGGSFEQYWYIGMTIGGFVEASLGDLSSYSQVFSNTVISDGEWHHIVWTRNGDLQTIFIDDVDRTNINYIDSGIGDVDSAQPLIIGGDVESDDYYLNGSLDAISIFTGGSIKGLWNFNEGIGSSVADESGNNNTGTAVEALWTNDYTYIPPFDPNITGTTGGPKAHRPEISIIFPKRGDIYSNNVKVKYEVTDKNDEIDFGKEALGLSEKPVSLFYSTTTDIRKKLKITEDLVPVGEYDWSVIDLLNGKSYMVIVEAVDKIGEFAQRAAGPFTIDQTPPVFTVSATPIFTRGENVSIQIQSSRELVSLPTVTVTQQEFQEVEVEVEQKEDYYIGTYTVFNEYDGTATISVSGTDVAGNIGTKILGTNTFSVNVAPPSRPVLISPIDNEVILGESVDVSGQARPDTTVALFINGTETGNMNTDKNGTFIFEKVFIDKNITNGLNSISIIATDKVGALSEAVTHKIIANSDPEVFIVSPEPGEILSGTVDIKLGVRDANSDKVTLLLEVSRDEISWTTLVRDFTEDKYTWDTTAFPDNSFYYLRVTAEDGFAKTVFISEPFSIFNLVGKITFTDTIFISNTPSITIEGTLEGTQRRGVRFVESVEYSLDRGISWNSVSAKDGKYDSSIEDFEFTLRGLSGGTHELLVRGNDKRGLVGIVNKVITIDLTPPSTPSIRSPQEGVIVSDNDDLNEEKAGVQIEVTGKAEPNTKISIINIENTSEGIVGENGDFALMVDIKEKGVNILQVTSSDDAGNVSGQAQVTVTYNNPPFLNILWPREGGGLNHSSEIIFEIIDNELDAIEDSELSYRRVGEEATHSLARNMADNTLLWNVSNLEEGSYELLLYASDGILEDTLVRHFIIDNTKPEVDQAVVASTVFTESVPLSADSSAQDELSGIEYVEYSVDAENWYKAIITDGYKETNAESTFTHPALLPDGKHIVSFRATDVAGNVSEETPAREIVVDTSPPRIGSFTLSTGLFTLFPEGRTFTILENTELLFTQSIERDAQSAHLGVGDTEFPLQFEAGLWNTEIRGLSLGTHSLTISATDSFGSVTDKKDIGILSVVQRGVVTFAGESVFGASMNILTFIEEDKTWREWQAESYGLENPIVTSERGLYSILLPSGKYRILLQKQGFQRLRSSDFTIINPRFINFNFLLEERRGIRGFLENIIEKIVI